MKIYTRTGDDGTTGTIGGHRLPKTDARIEAIGSLDELNAVLGLCRASPLPKIVALTLETMQSLLFDLGAELAAPEDDGDRYRSVQTSDIERLESEMDEMTNSLPALRSFILPGGSVAASQLHLARATARRAERAVLAVHESRRLRPEPRIYLNRLSDWLFTAARFTNAEHGIEDAIWRKRP